jgi:hypothetical protein
MRLRVLLPVALSLFCPSVLADGVQGLQEIYETSIPGAIRRNFDQTIHTHRTCPECPLGVLDGERFLDLYTKKFLVIGLSPNSFGGVWAIIAVEDEPKNAFRLWLYDIGDDEYDLRSIEQLADSLEEELIRQLRSPPYRHYWL